jgi:ribonuclease HII
VFVLPNLELEQETLLQGYSLVAGVDEVGRGPLAGPVVAGAVVLPSGLDPGELWLQGIDDSKQLTPRSRNKAVVEIRRYAIGVGVGMAGPAEIDDIGIEAATRRAMVRAVGSLPQRPEYLLVDFVHLVECGLPVHALVGGDRICYSIAAASILAKVTRDELMVEADGKYPLYGFAKHKGYPTAEHVRLLSLHGPSPIHRRSFRPLRPSTVLDG